MNYSLRQKKRENRSFGLHNSDRVTWNSHSSSSPPPLTIAFVAYNYRVFRLEPNCENKKNILRFAYGAIFTAFAWTFPRSRLSHHCYYVFLFASLSCVSASCCCRRVEENWSCARLQHTIFAMPSIIWFASCILSSAFFFIRFAFGLDDDVAGRCLWLCFAVSFFFALLFLRSVACFAHEKKKQMSRLDDDETFQRIVWMAGCIRKMLTTKSYALTHELSSLDQQHNIVSAKEREHVWVYSWGMDVCWSSRLDHTTYQHSIDFVKRSKQKFQKHTCSVNISANRNSRCVHTRSNWPSIAIMGECIECGIVDVRILHRLVLDFKCETGRHRVNKLVAHRTRDPRVFFRIFGHAAFIISDSLFSGIPPKRLHSRSKRCASLFLRENQLFAHLLRP